jgi:hypothetical protein
MFNCGKDDEAEEESDSSSNVDVPASLKVVEWFPNPDNNATGGEGVEANLTWTKVAKFD